MRSDQRMSQRPLGTSDKRKDLAAMLIGAITGCRMKNECFSVNWIFECSVYLPYVIKLCFLRCLSPLRTA